MNDRRAEIQRNTGETRIHLISSLDGKGNSRVRTGIAFFDHMLDPFARHSVSDLELECDGDLEVDAHHTVEDCGIALGEAVRETWDKLMMILSIVKKMITGHVSVKNLSGPITIAQVAGDSAGYSWRPYVGILAFLSLSLAVFNLLPVPNTQCINHHSSRVGNLREPLTIQI